MRARMALLYANVDFELREVDLKNKPAELLEASPKGTVPVLQLNDGTIIDESRDIMTWALRQNDPDHWLPSDPVQTDRANTLIDQNDQRFARQLTHYKYADRYPEHTEQYYREQAEVFLKQLETQLEQTAYLLAEQCSIADIALLPFIRQFAKVDPVWFEKAPYPYLQRWLSGFLHSPLFETTMRKLAQWKSPSVEKNTQNN